MKKFLMTGGRRILLITGAGVAGFAPSAMAGGLQQAIPETTDTFVLLSIGLIALMIIARWLGLGREGR